MSDQPGEKISLREAAYRRLRSDIVSLRLAPGARLTERQLTEDTGFGASPIRAALTRLDHEGLVLTLPRKGYQVRPLTPRAIENLFEVWLLVGPEIFRRGVKEATPEQQEEVRALLETSPLQKGESHEDHVVRLSGIGDGVTRLLAAATGNEYLTHIIDRLTADMSRVWMLVLLNDPEAVQMLANERAGGIANGDPEEAAEGSRYIITEFRTRVLDIISQWPSVIDAEIVTDPTTP